MSNKQQGDDITAWVGEAPQSIVDVFRSVRMLKLLREHRHNLFQLTGAYDGAMSLDCTELFRADYKAINEFIDAIAAKETTCNLSEHKGDRP
tara:strand:- start:13 stop:288 length:276 start_codon:yes stop_codon:yes gene_type:complete